MKILIGIKTKFVGDGFNINNAVNEFTIIEKGEKVEGLSILIKRFRADLKKIKTTNGEEYCATLGWFRQSPETVALHEKYGVEICKISYDYSILMVTEADVF
jgi:hypothetical protein